MWIDSFLEYLRLERNYSEKTVVSYGIDLREFEGYFKKADAEIDFTTVDADVVRNWVMHLMDEGRAATSVNRKLSTLRSFYRFILKKKVMAVNPMTKVVGPKKKKPLPSFVREKDMDRLLDGTSFAEGFEGCRDRLILEMFYATGMRLSELTGLMLDDVDCNQSQVRVTGKRNKQRVIPFGTELSTFIHGYIDARRLLLLEKGFQSKFFFISERNGAKMSDSKVRQIVQGYLGQVTTLRKKSPHVLRHSFATSMLNHRADLQSVKELLGHERLSTTEIYTHTTFEELKDMYNQAHPRAPKK